MPVTPSIVFILADQLRACSLPIYGESQIETPHLDRLAREGVVFTNAIATCPVCTPYRAMLLTGRHPQTTGHVINFVRTRHDEISIGDAFSRAGYRTAWIGKWHLHTGSFPQVEGQDYVPEGRDRLGFQYWRGYNFHCQYFNGWVNVDDWSNERWEGYETEALSRYAFEFLDSVGDEPFCLFLSPHQPHYTGVSEFAPKEYYARLPQEVSLPENVTDKWRELTRSMYRDYLAMTLALDDMVGDVLDHLQRAGRAEETLVIFTSDHGTNGGAHDLHPWTKKQPYEESIRVPLIMRLPGVLEGGRTCDTLTAPVDFFPSLCRLCGVPIPKTVEGYDLSQRWRGVPEAFEQDALLTMDFSASHDYLVDGQEWRGVRTKQYSYTRWLKGRVELYDIQDDPLQMDNLADSPEMKDVRSGLEGRLAELMRERNDELVPCSTYRNWFDNYRRVVGNASGPLGDPEAPPDWSLLGEPGAEGHQRRDCGLEERFQRRGRERSR